MSRMYNFLKIYILIITALALSCALMAQETRQLAVDKPQAVADLRTNEGAALVQGKWSIREATIREKDFRLPGSVAYDKLLLYPTGASIKTHTIHPQVTDADFDKGFRSIVPEDLETRQGKGLVSMVWYKADITVPERIGSLETRGSTMVFEIVMDDYSEIWVNGQQKYGFGQSGNGVIPGYNTRNRVILTENAEPGNTYSIAVLGINGPMGRIPDNYIWIRNAVIDFYKTGLPVNKSWEDIGKIFTIDPAINQVIEPGAKIEKVADGFSFTEGPVWHPDGFLLFSDPNTNTIYRYDPQNHNVTVYISHSGYTGADIGEYGQPGSNGLAIDKEGRLLVDQHGNRRVIRHEKKGPVTVMADRYEGKRFNSPNDIVIKSDGTIYFTDPPYGLPGFFNDPRKELDYSGVFMIKDSKVQLVSTDLGGPNGIAFSPDEKYLYVSNWDIRDIHHTKTLWRYEVNTDGTVKNGKVFFDFSFTEDEEALDGLKVDKQGNLFVSAPGGVWILNPQGKLLGKIVTPERPANMAWGDADGKTLYFTAHSSLYTLRVKTGGKFSWE